MRKVYHYLTQAPFQTPKIHKQLAMLTTSTDLLTEILMKLIAVQQKRPSAGKTGKLEIPFNGRKSLKTFRNSYV